MNIQTQALAPVHYFMNARREKCVLLIVLGLGIIARLWWFAYNPSLWNDEVSLANNIIKYDLAKIAITPLDDLQAAPPGYLLVEKMCGLLGGYSELSLRVFSLVCGLSALVLFVRLTGDLLVGWGRVVAVALFALSGPLIYHSSEVKQYQTEVLATVVLLWLAVWLREKISLPRAVFAGLVGMVCVLFANTAVFVLAGAFGALALNFAVKGKGRMAACVGLAMAMGGVAFSSYYFFVLRHNPNVAALKSGWAGHFAPLSISPAGLLWYLRTAFFAFVNPLGVSLDLDLPFLPHSTALKYLVSFSWPGLLLLGVGLVEFFRKHQRDGAIVLGGMAVTFLASLLHQYPLNERLIIFFAPMAYLILGKAAELARDPRDWRSFMTWFLLAWLALYVGVNFTAKMVEPRLFGGVEKYSQMREAIHFVTKHKQPNDVVFVTWRAMPFYDYYNYRESLNWKVVTGSDPRAGAHSEDDVVAHIVQQIQAAQKNNARVWFLIQDDLAPVTYVDARQIKHETLTPTGVIYEDILRRSVKFKIDEEYMGHAASAFLINNGA